MYHCVIPLLHKMPGHCTILHIGTNDAPHKSRSDVLNELLDLKKFIKENHPNCMEIIFSTPTICNNIEKARK